MASDRAPVPALGSKVTHSLAASLLILSLALTGCALLIEWGWDEPDQAFLTTHVRPFSSPHSFLLP